MEIAIEMLEDKTTLLQLQKPAREASVALKAPIAQLISMFAVQPSGDIADAAKNLHRVTNQSGVQLIRQIFPVTLRKNNNRSDPPYTALMILVRVYRMFHLKSEAFLPVILREERKLFLRQRSMIYTMLEASGCKVTLISGKKLIGTHLHGDKVAEGISVFKGRKGFHSKLTEPFLRLDRVPTRQVIDYAVPTLPVTHRLGSRLDNPSIPVGLPQVSTGKIVVCGSSNTELISTLQELIHSISKTPTIKRIFVIDTRSELNGFISYILQNPQLSHIPQMFRLGENVHLNLCDILVPLSPSGETQDKDARAAWKAHVISQILLNSFHTTEYLASRYAVPLESQIRKVAETNHLFSLRDVARSLSGVNDANQQISGEGTNMLFSDVMTIEALVGLLEQFRSFPEVNYQSFSGHYGNLMVQEGSLSFFQFGAQPPLIRRATVGFLLHYLSQTMQGGCVVLTHADEVFQKQTGYKRDQEIGTSTILETWKTIAANNVLILGNTRLQPLAVNMDNFEGVRNAVYLRLVNAQDRDIIINKHELTGQDPQIQAKPYLKQQTLGIAEGEGLLFREDVPQTVGFHFKLESLLPFDPKPIPVRTTKQRGAETLGLTPEKYELLMQLLKLMIHHPCNSDEAMALIEPTKHGELTLDYFTPLELYETQIDGGNNYWIITSKGREYYAKQNDFLNSLPPPLPHEKVSHVQDELKRLEAIYDLNSPQAERLAINTKVKLLVGQLLSLYRHLRVTSTPWSRVAEYHDLITINSLDWQDFRSLFSLAYNMVTNLMLEIDQLQKQQSEAALEDQLRQTVLRAESQRTNLDSFLPPATLMKLQELSTEIGVAIYPETGIVDLTYALKLQGRSLFEELAIKKERG
ncbi:MAG: hypothetical protein EAX86_09190 [Candidatus Heimdallarchaeota archaeon]|nr:hypothetical protein [Candidatus Heimdallarchaeota archaeon]